jgi:hypothetical protein
VLGIAWIASPLPFYRASGTGGVEVRRAEERRSDLVTLPGDESLRRRLGAAAVLRPICGRYEFEPAYGPIWHQDLTARSS